MSCILSSYRLASCFTWIASTCGIEIYWRSFQHFGNCNYSLRKIRRKKWQKMRQKLLKIVRKSRWFCTFSVISCLMCMWWGHGPSSPHPTTPLGALGHILVLTSMHHWAERPLPTPWHNGISLSGGFRQVWYVRSNRGQEKWVPPARQYHAVGFIGFITSVVCRPTNWFTCIPLCKHKEITA